MDTDILAGTEQIIMYTTFIRLDSVEQRNIAVYTTAGIRYICTEQGCTRQITVQ